MLSDYSKESIKFTCDCLISTHGILSISALIQSYGMSNFETKLQLVSQHAETLVGKKKYLVNKAINQLRKCDLWKINN